MSQLLQQVLNGLVNAAYLGLIAYAFSLTVGSSRIFNFGLGGMAGLAGAGMWLLSQEYELPFLPVLLVMCVLVALLNAVTYLVVYRPVLRRSGSPVAVLIASIGILIILNFSSSLVLEHTPRSLFIDQFGGVLRLGGLVLPKIGLVALVAAAVIIAAVEVTLRHTSYGVALRAVSDADELAELVGVQAKRVITVSYLISGALVAVASVFVGLLSSVDGFMGEDLVLIATVAAIVGGLSSRVGAVIGAILVAVVQATSLRWLDAIWQNTVAFAVLIAVILLLPQGIFGTRKAEKV